MNGQSMSNTGGTLKTLRPSVKNSAVKRWQLFGKVEKVVRDAEFSLTPDEQLSPLVPTATAVVPAPVAPAARPKNPLPDRGLLTADERRLQTRNLEIEITAASSDPAAAAALAKDIQHLRAARDLGEWRARLELPSGSEHSDAVSNADWMIGDLLQRRLTSAYAAVETLTAGKIVGGRFADPANAELSDIPSTRDRVRMTKFPIGGTHARDMHVKQMFATADPHTAPADASALKDSLYPLHDWNDARIIAEYRYENGLKDTSDAGFERTRTESKTAALVKEEHLLMRSRIDKITGGKLHGVDL